MHDQRRPYRKRAFRAAFIGMGESSPSFCMVRDLSAEGARLALAPGAQPPDSFDLEISGRNKVMQAQTVWRTATEIGVRFSGARRAPKP